MQRDYFYPKLADRGDPRTWSESGGRDLWSKAREKARNVLATHYPEYIDEATDATIRGKFNILLPTERIRRPR
jgi:trimethylamine--corrinoid protein Co-methyltransferase